MKRLVLVVVALSFLMVSGCASLSNWFNTNQGTLSLDAGKAIGIYVGKQYPADSAAMLPTAETLLADLKNGNIGTCDFNAVINNLLSGIKMDTTVKVLMIEAVDSVCITIPVNTTQPVNADMIAAIQGIVDGIKTTQAVSAKRLKAGKR
jgi:uncharacterized protein YceK